jgi:glycosyltransferase involved in cell wall biosynthesis
MKITIVTPTFNSDRYLASTIHSVLSQEGSFDIEFILVDNNSIDSTISIFNAFRDSVLIGTLPIMCNSIEFKCICQNDDGMYSAINKGFYEATGDIYAWINSDDIYLPGAFATIDKIFKNHKRVKWLKGITSYINEESMITKTGECVIYDKSLILKGIYGIHAPFIQQDSVFWRRELWEKSGGINPKYKYAGDYYLWKMFAQRESLYSVCAYISCFRKVKGQKSENISKYFEECRDICKYPKFNILSVLFFKVNNIRQINMAIKKILYFICVNRRKNTFFILDANGISVKTSRFYKV